MRRQSLRVSDDMIWSGYRSTLKRTRLKGCFKNFKEKQFKAEFKRRLRAFFASSSINCYRYLVDDTLQPWERWIWKVVHILATIIAGYVVYVAIAWALDAPTVTSASPSGIPLNMVPHPAIALCSFNKIDSQRASVLADQILAKNDTYTKEELLRMIRTLGLTYIYKNPQGNEFDDLHDILSPYDLDDIMKNLTTPCDEILVRCTLRSEVIDCSKVFHMRRTSEGFCCTFNYRRENDYSISKVNRELPHIGFLTAAPSIERGLSVLVDPKLERYMYTDLPNVGFKILIFHSEDYADIDTGSGIEKLLPPRTEVYTSVNAITVRATAQLERIPQKTRKCLASFERTIFYDSYCDCMAVCKLESVRRFCGCVPYTLPAMNSSDVCNLQKYECLSRWRYKWLEDWGQTYEPEFPDEEDEQFEPPCAYCIPDCSDNRFNVQQNAINLQSDYINSQPDPEKIELMQGVMFENHSVLHVFFPKDVVFSLRHDILYTWYDWLSSLGGLFGLVLGCSILSAVEAIYFLAFGGPPVAKRQFRPHKERMRRLYWRELGANI